MGFSGALTDKGRPKSASNRQTNAGAGIVLHPIPALNPQFLQMHWVIPVYLPEFTKRLSLPYWLSFRGQFTGRQQLFPGFVFFVPAPSHFIYEFRRYFGSNEKRMLGTKRSLNGYFLSVENAGRQHMPNCLRESWANEQVVTGLNRVINELNLHKQKPLSTDEVEGAKCAAVLVSGRERF